MDMEWLMPPGSALLALGTCRHILLLKDIAGQFPDAKNDDQRALQLMSQLQFIKIATTPRIISEPQSTPTNHNHNNTS